VAQAPREAVVDRVVEDVLHSFFVLVLRLDDLRPEAAAEDVVLAAVPVVEGTCVLAVEVAHARREICERGFEEEVVVVPEQAAGVHAPAMAPADAPQDLDEDGAVPVVAEDRVVVVPLRPDVVVGALGEVAVRSSHAVDRIGAVGAERPA
jgi:hypothetical protein